MIRRVIAFGLGMVLLSLFPRTSTATDFIQVQLHKDVYAVAKNGRRLSLTCLPPSGAKGKAFLERFLAGSNQWKRYVGKGSVGIPFDALNPETQRQVLLAVFEDDVRDERGWLHTVLNSGETLWSLCEWLTGRGTDYRQVMKDNGISDTELVKGQQVLIRTSLLREAMRKGIRKRRRSSPAGVVASYEATRELSFAFDKQGQYAVYGLKAGETLYTSVAKRFTDAREHNDVMKVCRAIQSRSGIQNARGVQGNTEVRIPLDLLSDRYRPRQSTATRGEESAIKYARLPKKYNAPRRTLDGVVIVLDPGHGGKATGTMNASASLYEDEVVYDICCRIYDILSKKTSARVYFTMIDKSQGIKPTNKRRFSHDEDEVLLTTPTRYPNTNVTASLHLRSYISNSIYRKAIKEGIDPRNIVFTSFHADALGNGRTRGTMVYIPGAEMRGLRPASRKSGAPYTKFNEYHEQPRIVSTAWQRNRDEAYSRDFAETFIDALGLHNPPIRRHKDGEPIRDRIRQENGSVYVPSVLKHNDIPTKILIETANMSNGTDRQRMADPEWRQWFAEAYVDSLQTHFSPRSKVAKAP